MSLPLPDFIPTENDVFYHTHIIKPYNADRPKNTIDLVNITNRWKIKTDHLGKISLYLEVIIGYKFFTSKPKTVWVHEDNIFTIHDDIEIYFFEDKNIINSCTCA